MQQMSVNHFFDLKEKLKIDRELEKRTFELTKDVAIGWFFLDVLKTKNIEEYKKLLEDAIKHDFGEESEVYINRAEIVVKAKERVFKIRPDDKEAKVIVEYL